MPTYNTCPQNTKSWREAGSQTSFSDPTIVADETEVRKLHIDELRAAVQAERLRRNREVAADFTFEDATIVANQTEIRMAHIADLRSAIASTNSMTCTTDVAETPAWTDDPLVADQTEPRKPHVDELRTGVNSLEAQCICNCEFCNYCADCGNRAPCGCDDHASTECSFSCGSVNTGFPSQTPTNDWCVHDYGLNWTNHGGGSCPLDAQAATYGCMCTPFGCMC